LRRRPGPANRHQLRLGRLRRNPGLRAGAARALGRLRLRRLLDRMGRPRRHTGRDRSGQMTKKGDPDKPGLAEATRLIRSGGSRPPLARTVGPPIQRGSTVLMPDAASLYDHSQITYGRNGLAAQTALSEALGE